MIKKMWISIDEGEKRLAIILLAIFFIFSCTLLAFVAGRSSTALTTVLKNELATFTVGNGDAAFVIAISDVQNPNKDAALLSSDVQKLLFVAHKSLTAIARSQCEVDGKRGLEVEFWAEGSEKDSQTICLKVDSFIMVSQLEDSFWDGMSANGFKNGDWEQFVVAPQLYLPSPPKPTPTSKATD